MRLEHQYKSLAEDVERAATDLPAVFCGFSACIDHIYDADTIIEYLDRSGGETEKELKRQLLEYINSGRGGELEFSWPDGLRFFDAIQPKRTLPGGTAVQAANQLALIGACPVLALEHRDPDLTKLLHANVVLAPPSDSCAASGSRRAFRHPIIEFAANSGPEASPRADRIILRFGQDEFEFDDAFADYTADFDGEIGAAIVSGFNALSGDAFDDALIWAHRLASQWASSGVPLLHLELADFTTPAGLVKVLKTFGGTCNSVGMNAAELATLNGEDAIDEASLDEAVHRVAESYGFDRVNVHADRWVMSLTRDDPAKELRAIRYGSLTASARAAAGRPVAPVGLPPGATLHPLPWPEIRPAGAHGHFVGCPTPHHMHPATTIGLGDSFLAGTLAVLAASNR